MTTLAPLPGRESGPDDEGEAESGSPDVVVLPDSPTVDLGSPRPKPPYADPAAQAAWVFGIAHALLFEGAAERVVMAEVLAEAAGRSRVIEGAYGRAVALLNEFPGDPLVHRTVDLLAKALLRSRRPARVAGEG